MKIVQTMIIIIIIVNDVGSMIEHDIIAIPSNLMGIPGRNSSATQDLVFTAADVPALGVTNYYVQAAQAPPVDAASTLQQTSVNDSVVILDNGVSRGTFVI